MILKIHTNLANKGLYSQLTAVMKPNKEDIYGGETHNKSSKALTMIILVIFAFVCVIGLENEKEARMRIQLKLSMETAKEAFQFAAGHGHNIIDKRERAAWQDCVMLLEDTVDDVNASLNKIALKERVVTWLSAALTNVDTCTNGFTLTEMNITSTGNFTTSMLARTVNVTESVTKSLSMYSRLFRHVLQKNDEELGGEMNFDQYEGGFSGEWVSTPTIVADAVVAKDGSGEFGCIKEAVNSAPEKSRRRYVIYIKAGVYRENVEIPKWVTNLMLVGDGKEKTVVTGCRNNHDGYDILTSPTVAVSGEGFIARDMTFENTAGAEKGQAVALRVSADMAVIYRCSIKGYQDTLFAHTHRQFYREVDIYGTVDFIFGNAAVVIQNSNIIARRPLKGQANAITAQGRTSRHQHTGIIIQNCRVSADSDLQPVKESVRTYLGRPWKKYSRTVFMQCTLDDLIDPAGWLQWDRDESDLSSLYYGEYMNDGAGAGTSGRVKWGGYHVITSARKARRFTVRKFIYGNSWIPPTTIPFTSGLWAH